MKNHVITNLKGYRLVSCGNCQAHVNLRHDDDHTTLTCYNCKLPIFKLVEEKRELIKDSLCVYSIIDDEDINVYRALEKL